MSGPLRKVEKATMHSGRGSLLGGDTNRRTRWWDATLECGHDGQSPVRYTKLHRRRIGGSNNMRSADDALPPPARMRCGSCEAARSGTGEGGQ